MKLDILVIAAHPDDAELGVGGTILKSIQQGKKVGIVDLTEGQLGSRGTPETRLKEAENAAGILGLSARENLGMQDGFFSNDKTHQLQIVEMIRKYQPEIVIANAEYDRHPDHGKASKLISDSCFLAGLLALKTTSGGSEQEAWRPKHVYHFIQDRYIKPDFIIDISDFYSQKMQAIMAYETQFHQEGKKSEGPETAISTPGFIHALEARAREYGRLIDAEFGEGFTAERVIGVDDLFALR